MYFLVVWLVVKPFCQNTVRMTAIIVGSILVLVPGFVFARSVVTCVARTYLFAAITYSIVIFPMLKDYIKLVSRHLTQKEKVARIRAKKENNLESDKLKEGPLTCSKALSRHYRFFCKSKVTKSYI